MVVLVRLLSPRTFGLVSMVTIFTGFAAHFGDVGLAAALIQHQDLKENHLSSVFWLNIAIGAFLTALFVLLSPKLAAFYGEPTLRWVTILLSLQFLIEGFGVVDKTLLRKSIDFRTLSLVSITANTAGGFVGISMALSDYGAISLVGKSLITSFVEMTFLRFVTNWTPSFLFKVQAIRDLWRFSLNLLGTRSMNYWVRKIDDLVIGRFLGSEALGVYTKAYQVLTFPLSNISRVLGRVMFPALAEIQDNIERVRRVYLKMTGTISLFSFPVFLGTLATAEPFVLTIFGPQWIGMIEPLMVLCCAGVWQSIATLNGNLYLSQGRSDLQFRVSLFTKPLMIIGILIGLKWGLIGVVVGFAGTSFCVFAVEYNYAGGLVGLGVRDILEELSGVFACAATMGLSVYGLSYLLPSRWPVTAQFLIQVSFGACFYLSLIHLFELRAYENTKKIVLEQWREKTSSEDE